MVVDRGRKLSRKRSNHIANRRAGIRRGRFHPLYEPTGIVAPSKDTPWHIDRWECAGCGTQLPLTAFQSTPKVS